MCWEGKPASYTERAQSTAAGLAEYKLLLQTAFIFSQGLQKAATSHSPGKTLAGKKKQQAATFTPWQKLKSWATGSGFQWRLGTCFNPKVAIISLPSFLSSKNARGQVAAKSSLFYCMQTKGFLQQELSLIYHPNKQVIITLGYYLMPNDWEGREHFQLKGQSLYVFSNQRHHQKESKGFWVGNKKVSKWFDLQNLQGQLHT